MTEQPKWMPSKEEISASVMRALSVFGDDRLTSVRNLISTAVEKALAGQETRHKREVIEARIEELGYARSNDLAGKADRWAIDRFVALRAALAALDKEES